MRLFLVVNYSVGILQSDHIFDDLDGNVNLIAIRENNYYIISFFQIGESHVDVQRTASNDQTGTACLSFSADQKCIGMCLFMIFLLSYCYTINTTTDNGLYESPKLATATKSGSAKQSAPTVVRSNSSWTVYDSAVVVVIRLKPKTVNGPLRNENTLCRSANGWRCESQSELSEHDFLQSNKTKLKCSRNFSISTSSHCSCSFSFPNKLLVRNNELLVCDDIRFSKRNLFRKTWQ